MVLRDELTATLTELLQPQLYNDYCPNGLQVAGKAVIRNIVTGVTASLALLEAAVAVAADAVLVHHGIFWKGEPQPLVGIKHQRIATLMHNDLNLFAYHLPLDCHLTLGNNVQLAQLLHFKVTRQVTVDHIPNLLWLGELAQPLEATAFAALIAQRLQRQPLLIAPPQERIIKNIAWCSGSAQKYLELASYHGADAYLSGEISEATVHIAREAGVYYFAAGHHATERYGIRAVGQYLADKFQLQHQFIEIDNPV